MRYYEIRRTTGEIVASNMSQCAFADLFQNDKNLLLPGRHLKSVYKEYDGVKVWIIIENEDALLKSSKLLSSMLRMYKDLSEDLLSYYLNKIHAHSHTLRSIQGKMKQKIDGLASKEDFDGTNYQESKEKIARRITADVDGAADVICQLNKRVAEVDAHIGGFDVLYMGDKKEIRMREVNIKKVMLNILAPFLYSLKENAVSVQMQIDDEYAEEQKIPIDYNLFDLALHNFFDNATKYAEAGTKIYIQFEKNNNSYKITVIMMSLRIERDELERIFDEGYSGKNAKADAGEGIGMSVAKKALGLMRVKISIIPNYSKSSLTSGRKFVENVFTFEGSL